MQKRFSKRKKFYLSDNFKVRISSLKKEQEINGNLLDINTEGISLAIDTNEKLNTGEEVILSFSHSHETFSNNAIILHQKITKISGKNKIRLGFKFISKTDTSQNRSKRQYNRYTCNEFFTISAWCHHPFLFQERIFFKIIELSPDGMTLHCSARNNFLIKNMPIQLNISIPGSVLYLVESKITNIRKVKNQDLLRLGVSYTSCPRDFKCSIGEYLLFTKQNLDSLSLAKQGYRTLKISGKLSFDYVSDKNEMINVLKLRLKAYRKDYESFESLSYMDLTDQFDNLSRHFFYRINNIYVAAGRITFLEGNFERSQLYSQYKMKLPQWVLKSNVVEITKLCVDPDYRNTDIFLNLLKTCLLIAAQTGHDYILGVADDMMSSYKRIGFEPLEAKTYIKEHGVTLQAMILKVNTLLKGEGISTPLYQKFKVVDDYLSEHK